MIYCNTDGSISHNPGGRIGIGVFISDNNIETLAEIHKEFEASPEYTVNVAEYLALKECLDWLMNEGYADEKILIRSDSQLLVRQMNGEWRIKKFSENEKWNPQTRKLEINNTPNAYYRFAIHCEIALKLFKDTSFKWIPREQNETADALSKCEKTFKPLPSGRMGYKEFKSRKEKWRTIN